MPGEETKHEPVGQWGTGYQHVVTQLNFTPVRYADYSAMLKAIEDAGSNIINYLNPKTIQQMKTDVMSSKAGQQYLQLITSPEYRNLLLSQGYTQGGKFGMQPAYENPMIAPGLAGVPGGKTTGDGSKPAAVDVHSVGPANQPNNQTLSPNQQPPVAQPNQYPQIYGSIQRTQDPFADQNFSNLVPNTPQYATEGGATGGTVTQGGIVPPIHRQQGGPVPFNQTYFGGQGVPQPPAAQPTPTPQPTPVMPARTPTYFAGQPAENRPVMFSPGPNQVPPPPMPQQVQTPGALPGHIPYSPESQAQAYQQGTPLAPEEMARRQQEQQNLTAWQNQTQGGVLSAVEARDWAKNAIDTDITRAVYLPQGGPPGPGGQKEPAYAFYGKKNGAANVVPISQMVKAGAGPLVAAGNITQMLSSGGQQGQQPQGQPQGQPQPPQLAGAAPPSVGGPPPAPGGPPGSQVPQLPGGGTNWGALPGQLPNDEFAARVDAATRVPGKGGPLVNALLAANNPVGDTIGADGRNVVGNLPTQDDMDKAQANLKANKYQSNEYDIDQKPDGTDVHNPSLGQIGAFKWYASDGGTGLPYTDRQGANGWYRERMWWGDPTWHPILPNANQARQDLLNTAYGKSLGMPAINKMSQQELSDALYRDYYINNILPTTAPLEGHQAADMENNFFKIQNGYRLLHAIEGQNPQDFSFSQRGQNEAIKMGQGLYKSNPQTPWEQASNVLGKLFGLPTGQAAENERLNFVQQQESQLINRMNGRAQDAFINPVDMYAGDKALGGIGLGSPYAPAALKRIISGWQQEWDRDMDRAKANRARLPGQWLDFQNDLHAGKSWYDPQDTFGNSRKKDTEQGPLAIADAANRFKPPGLTNPSPPAAPGQKAGPGSSEQNPVLLHSDADWNGLQKGQHWKDETGRTGVK